MPPAIITLPAVSVGELSQGRRVDDSDDDGRDPTGNTSRMTAESLPSAALRACT